MKVLFLGAGASVPGGYPPGARLLDAVEDFFAKEVTDGASREAWGRFTTWRTEAAEKEATRLLLGSTNPEVVISYMDLVEQAAESEYIRLEAALRDGLNTLKRTTDPTAHQTTYEWILEGQEAGYRSPDLGVARKVQRARRDLRLSINAFLEFSHFRDRDRFPSGPEYLAAVMARLTSPSVVITTNYDCHRGTAYVSGGVSGKVTIGGNKDVVVTGDLTRTNGASGKDTVGLIASGYVWVYHPLNASSSGGTTPPYSNLLSTPVDTIEAAVLSTSHSFVVQNWQGGSALGQLHVSGAIAQRFRGAVGTTYSSGSKSGYDKDYQYDQRFAYLEPPHFLLPLTSPWYVDSVRDGQHP